ncbi:MAG: hypothetical protein Q9179_006115 [Wetmoreana sp. 5 TL-2023]
MSGTSNVGGRGVYEAGDQRNVKESEANEAERYKEGQPNSHLANDSSTQRPLIIQVCYGQKLTKVRYTEDQRSIANKLAREEKARNHGNEPSKGAKIDAELQQEEEETLRKKGIKK